MDGMNWPSDEIMRNREPPTLKNKLKTLLKIFIAFADEAVIIAVVIYLIYRYSG